MNQPVVDLLADFDKLGTAEWIQSIEKYLKGKPYSSTFHSIEDDIEIAPFYRKTETTPLNLAVVKNNQWKITESFICKKEDASIINKAILEALEGGTERIVLKLEAEEPSILDQLLNGVYLNMVELQLEGNAIETHPLAWAKAIASLQQAKESKGLLRIGESTDPTQAAQLLQQIITTLPHWSCFVVSVAPISEETSVSKGLADALKTAEALFWAALDQGLDKNQLIQTIYFDIEVKDDYFMSIARLRAMHKLWATVLKGYELEGQAQLLVSTSKSAASDDPYWNMIAASTQGLSAALGQAYSIEIKPSAIENIGFGRRIARNLQHLLKMESHINEIIDPAAGSYYIENYSMKISEKAWTQFIQ